MPSRLHWFETEVLSHAENLEGLSRINRELLAKADMDSPQRVMLDMDSTEIPVYGEQEHSAYNGHFESTCYHPLLLFNGEGDCLGASCDRATHTGPRTGTKSSARNRAPARTGEGSGVSSRCLVCQAGDLRSAGRTWSEIAIRLPANDNLLRDIEAILTRPVGRYSHEPILWYKGFLYQAASWKTARRVMAKVEYHAGELFPSAGFIVTNLETPSRLVRFYNKWVRRSSGSRREAGGQDDAALSCHRFRSNQVRLALRLLAYNLGKLWRRLVLPRGIENWSLTSLQQRLAKTGGRLVEHARYYWLLPAEGHLTRWRFGAMLGRIARLPVPTG